MEDRGRQRCTLSINGVGRGLGESTVPLNRNVDISDPLPPPPSLLFKEFPIRNLIILFLVVTLCSSCAQLPRSDVPLAPEKLAQAVVFDIDGTLTPNLLSFFEARTDAAKAVRIFDEKGYKIIYLSARIRLLQTMIPSWLKEHGFPVGSIHLPQTNEDRRHPYGFKTRILKIFINHGWNVKFAYGDSSSDFKAYAAVGIPKERVFALLRDGETSCEQGDWKECLNGWTEHLEFVMKSVQSVPSR